MRQVVLDTETTGLEATDHRVIEIGAIELVDRRPSGKTLHHYLNPQRDIDDAAVEVHGLTRAFLADKPLFGSVANELLAFIAGAELVIHNAAFDIEFLNAELRRLDAAQPRVESVAAGIVDSLLLARQKHPGQKNSLEALCRRYAVDDSHRQFHGALLDAQLLADVYLAMTGGQTSLLLATTAEEQQVGMMHLDFRRLVTPRPMLPIIAPSFEDEAAHEQTLARLQRAAGKVLWRLLPHFQPAPADTVPAQVADH